MTTVETTPPAVATTTTTTTSPAPAHDQAGGQNPGDRVVLAPGQYSASADAAPAPVRTSRQWRRIMDPRRISFGIVLLVAVWAVGSAVGFIDERVLPGPWDTAVAAGELIASGDLPENLLVSLQRAAIGGAIGIAVGLVLAVVAGLSSWGQSLIDGPVQINRAVPTLAFIPLAIAWFGVGETMKIVVIVLSVMVPVYINTHSSLRGLERRYRELAHTVDLSRTQFITRIALPGALPGFFVGLRIAVILAWSALVVVEQINATSGIGYLMSQARTYGQIDVIVVGLVVYATLGLLSDLLIRLLERKALSWRETISN